MKGKRIPVSKAKQISKQYNYDHVIVIAWNMEDGRSWWTTYGKNKDKCAFTAKVSEDLREHLMEEFYRKPIKSAIEECKSEIIEFHKDKLKE